MQAELAALRATKLFSFTVGNDVEPSSNKSVLEICWETIERVQHLNRRIALYQGARERIERSGKFHYFLIRVAGIAGGPVAESKAMNPRYDRRVRDYEAEAACPNYLIESFGDNKVADKPTFKKDKPWSGLQVTPLSTIWQTPNEVPFGPLNEGIVRSGRPTTLNLFSELLESTREEAA